MLGFYLKQDIIYLTSFVDTFLPDTLLGRFNLDNASQYLVVRVFS